MYTQSAQVKIRPGYAEPPALDEVFTSMLKEGSRDEVLAFLERRPIHTAMLAGLIRDNGLQNPLNRGYFYVCRNRRGEIEGVALIGHATLFETSTDRALESLALIAQKCATTHMIMGETESLDQFRTHYSAEGFRACREHLIELRCPIDTRPPVPELRPALMKDLDVLLPIHAQMAFEESGVNPLEQDPEGFRERYARRIQNNRTWVLIESGKVVFKAEIVSSTSHVAYLEGIWVNPENRGHGRGTDCLLNLAKLLLSHSQSICIFVNEENDAARRFYKRAGFKARGIYDTFFLTQPE